jgi:UPF0755 protein
MLKRLFVLVVVLVLGAGAAAWWTYQRIETPYRGFAEPEVFVDLPPGTGVAGIASRLAAAGVVPDALTFRIAARLSGDERRLQAGEYRFDAPASPVDIVGRLARGDVFVRAITFPEGHTIAEMAAIFEKSGIGSRAEFERAARDGSAVGDIDPGAENLEGYLFPDTYALPRGAGAEGTVAAMVARFKAAFDSELREAAMADRWSARDIVTLASLVEKETAAAEERPLVAAVYRNRLKVGMPLQCDPTVIYALMKMRRWNGNLTRADLGLNSPYNTYRFPGLPPGPIASPGKASLEAAVHPADVPYLYFVSRNDGTHAFATTLAEHNRNVAEWQVNYFRRKR